MDLFVLNHKFIISFNHYPSKWFLSQYHKHDINNISQQQRRKLCQNVKKIDY